jgi:hypothetical protein
LDLDDELNTLDLLRKHIPDHGLHLVDLRRRLAEAIRKDPDGSPLDLFPDDDIPF